MSTRHTWQRVVLLAVLAYEGLGALLGGGLLVARTDGHYMNLPVALMHDTFRDFLLPGALLFGLGILNVTAFFAVLRRSRLDWLAAGLAVGGFLVWFFVEIVIVRELHWLHVMWGFPVLLGAIAVVALSPFAPATMRTAWLVCGVASSLFYVAMNVIVAARAPGYDAASQTISELSAVGVPTRPLWVVMGLVYTLLVMAMGWGVRLAAGGQRRLEIAGVLLLAYGALGFVWPFAPMHPRAVLAAGGGSFSDTLHLALGAVTTVLFLLALGFAAGALGRAFRVYSAATFAVIVAFGVLMAQGAPAVGRDAATPLLGVWERVGIGVFLLWIVVLAIALLRRGAAGAPARRGATTGGRDLRPGWVAPELPATGVRP